MRENGFFFFAVGLRVWNLGFGCWLGFLCVFLCVYAEAASLATYCPDTVATSRNLYATPCCKLLMVRLSAYQGFVIGGEYVTDPKAGWMDTRNSVNAPPSGSCPSGNQESVAEVSSRLTKGVPGRQRPALGQFQAEMGCSTSGVLKPSPSSPWWRP